MMGRTSSAAAADKAEAPQGALVRISPNPTTRSGQEITITGDCGEAGVARLATHV